MDPTHETTPDELLDTFRGRSLKSIVLFTLAVHAVILLGTGMPTLTTLASQPRVAGAAVLSSTLALAWHALECLQGRQHAPSPATLHDMLSARTWRHRLDERLGHRPQGCTAPPAAPGSDPRHP